MRKMWRGKVKNQRYAKEGLKMEWEGQLFSPKRVFQNSIYYLYLHRNHIWLTFITNMYKRSLPLD